MENADILVVDDNADDADLTMRALRRDSPAARIVHAEDGMRALDYLFAGGEFTAHHAEKLPRLVLLDLKLPRMNGTEILKRIRTDPRTRAVPVVIFSSSGEERD